MTDLKRIKRALISISDKTGIVEFARALQNFEIEIISTGGTASVLRDAGVSVTDVSDVTGFPEMMDGRIKTLHPKIHGGLLALRDNVDHVTSMTEHGIEPIDLVVINLYPFEQTIAKHGVTLDDAIENIDIGGPSMIRSAAKNFRDVAVVTAVEQYVKIIKELTEFDGCLSIETRNGIACEAFGHTTNYDSAIHQYLSHQLSVPHPYYVSYDTTVPPESPFNHGEVIYFGKVRDLRYGENPHQHAALYTDQGGGVANAEQLHGKEMSYNNFVDADAAWSLVSDFDELAVAIIKHTNPSGVGVGITNEDAYRRARSTDPVSAFGGIVAFNRKVCPTVAGSVNEVFTEVIIASDYEEAALEIFRTKKNLRVLRVSSPHVSKGSTPTQYKQISGGFLVQDADVKKTTKDDLTFVTERKPTDAEITSMMFAWSVCKHVRSNAIVLANRHQTLGVGAGQMNRVDSIRIAGMRAERFDLSLNGAALASDAFFPFRDNVDEAANLGITAIIQPGGSIKDEESIAAANEHGIAMAFTGVRHFKH